MKKFEYFSYVTRASWEESTRQINEYGREGWELVAVTPQTSAGGSFAFVYTFKREL